MPSYDLDFGGWKNEDGERAPILTGSPSFDIFGGLSNMRKKLMGGGSDGGGEAARMRAELLRRDFSDWATRYAPIEERLLGLYGNPAERTRAQASAQQSFHEGFGRSMDAGQRRMQGYGIQLTPDQQQSYDRNAGLSRSLGEVEAYNRTGRALDARDQMIATGTSGRRTYGVET